ncbi:MAG: S41 family peptidase [Pseudomonadota bacterium]
MYQGSWLAPGYGRVLEIGTDSLRLLDYTDSYCLVTANETEVTTKDIESLFRLSGNQLEWFSSVGTAEYGAPAVRFQSVASLPASCNPELTPTVGEAGYKRDPRRDLRLFAELIAEYSIYPSLRDIDVFELFEQQAALLSIESNDQELTEALFRLAEPFADIHATVETSEGLIKVLNKPSLQQRLVNEWLLDQEVTPPLSVTELEALNEYILEQAIRDRAITLSYANNEADIRRAANGLLTWFEVDGVGYLAVDAMLGFGDIEDNEDELVQLDRGLDIALQDLRDAEVLVLDIRRNGGGKDFLSIALAGRFIANETQAYRKQARDGDGRTELREVYASPRGSTQYLGPIVLLTSNETASAAEVFTLIMRELPNVTLLGESTQGGLSDQLDKKLTNGWGASVGNEFYLSVQDEWFEGTGIPVDVQVPQFERSARDAGVDSALETLTTMLEE